MVDDRPVVACHGNRVVFPEIGRMGGTAAFANCVRHYSFVFSGCAGIAFCSSFDSATSGVGKT